MPSTRREFLQLAATYKGPDAPKAPSFAGWVISEKLDGTRCFWDGGVTRGMATDSVPWANLIDPKTGNRKAKIKPVSTGLWSRYGNPIMAPDEFLNLLPMTLLDGELWAGRGNFQLCRSICAGDEPDSRFMEHIQFACYGAPPLQRVFRTGEIKNSNFHKQIDLEAILAFYNEHAGPETDFQSLDPESSFFNEIQFLNHALDNDRIFLHSQSFLPDTEPEATEAVEEFMANVIERGGEGVIIRDSGAIYEPKRVKALYKYKPYDDAEVMVNGFISGRETDKGSKLLGMIGALITDFKGKRLEIAGLTNEEREFADADMTRHAAEHPGQDMPKTFQGRQFRVGDVITIKYRELSDDGIPKEARYFRRPMPERARA